MYLGFSHILIWQRGKILSNPPRAYTGKIITFCDESILEKKNVAFSQLLKGNPKKDKKIFTPLVRCRCNLLSK